MLRTVILAWASLGSAAQERPAVFSAHVEGVRVDVQVTRRGRPVAGLGADDFELRDNGVVQTIESVTREDVPLDLSLLLDSSGSVAGERLEALAAAARIAVETLLPEDRIALITFSHRLRGSAPLSSNKTAALRAIDEMTTATGGTSLVDAVYATLVLRQPSPRRALIIVFTDGQDTSSWLRASVALDLAKETDAVVYGVVLTSGQSARGSPLPLTSASELLAGRFATPKPQHSSRLPAFLEELSVITGGRVLDAAEPRALRDLFSQAVRDMKTRYVLSYVPKGVEREGWHAVDVRVTKHKADVTARRGYFVAPQRERE